MRNERTIISISILTRGALSTMNEKRRASLLLTFTKILITLFYELITVTFFSIVIVTWVLTNQSTVTVLVFQNVISSKIL